MPKKLNRLVESWWFVLRAEREKPKEEQSRFLLKPLTQAERMRVWDDESWVTVAADGSRTVSGRGFQQARELALTNIADVENFPIDGPLPWPKSEEEREKYLEMLDDMDVFEIGNEVRERCVLEEAAKNS